MTLISWRTTLLAGALLGLACTTDVCGCPPLPASAALYGRVQTADGAPVAEAQLAAYVAWDGDCSRREFPDGTAGTRDDGTYSLRILGGEETQGTCVRVRVQAPFESNLLDGADTTVNLAFRYTEPFDSTRVDATLSAP